MFTLFALLPDASGGVTNDSLIRDVKKGLPGVEEFEISKKELVFPKVTVVLLQKLGWRVRLQIRKDEGMTLSLPELQRILGTKTQLPADFSSYNTEIAIGFGDDPEKQYTNDIIFVGEFVRENFPGVVIFDQYNEDVW